MYRTLLLAATTALVMAAAGTAHANLLKNGGFETGAFTHWNVSDLNFVGVAGSGFDGYPAHSGAYFAAFGTAGSLGSIAQTFSDTAGQTLTIDFWLAASDNLNDFEVDFNGTPVFPLQSVGPQLYTEITETVTGTGSDTLKFLERDDLGYFALDDISVNPAAAVPEPSSLMLFGSGLLLALAFLRRRGIV